MEHLPPYITIIFQLTVFATIGFLLYALETANAKRWKIYATVFLIGCWMVMQAYLATIGYYTIVDGKPRFAAALIGPLLAIILVFALRRDTLLKMSLPVLTMLSVVRIPVEFCIDQWYHAGLAPQLMTFEGRNFDIVSGITAPIVFFLAFRKGKVNRPLLMGWNIVCLVLLLNIVANAVTSIPGPMQLQAFDQPNTALLHYPFIWLPSVIVPAVLFSHLVSLYG